MWGQPPQHAPPTAPAQQRWSTLRHTRRRAPLQRATLVLSAAVVAFRAATPAFRDSSRTLGQPSLPKVRCGHSLKLARLAMPGTSSGARRLKATLRSSVPCPSIPPDGRPCCPNGASVRPGPGTGSEFGRLLRRAFRSRSFGTSWVKYGGETGSPATDGTHSREPASSPNPAGDANLVFKMRSRVLFGVEKDPREECKVACSAAGTERDCDSVYLPWRESRW